MSERLFYVKTESGLYLRLNEKGRPLSTADISKADSWPEDKARNLTKHLPKTLQKVGKWFMVPVPIIEKEEKPAKPVRRSQVTKEDDRFSTYCDPNILTAFRYEVPSEVLDWTGIIEAVHQMQAKTKERLEELQHDLQQSELERIDILHIIELDPPKSLYEAWKIYRRLRENLLLRRKVKDEIESIRLFVSTVTVNELADQQTKEFLTGLETRYYNYRVEDGVDNYNDVLDEPAEEEK